MSINHDQIDHDGDVYEEEDKEDERVVEEEREEEKEIFLKKLGGCKLKKLGCIFQI